MSHGRVHTTLNLTQSDATLLDEKAKELRMKRSEIVALMMRKMLAKLKKIPKKFESVSYQKDINDEGWKCVHVFFDGIDYEVFIDMRKFFKWSVSALVAMALKRFVNDFSEINEKNIKVYCDNYKIISYDCDGKLNKNIFCWHIKWELGEIYSRKFI